MEQPSYRSTTGGSQLDKVLVFEPEITNLHPPTADRLSQLAVLCWPGTSFKKMMHTVISLTKGIKDVNEIKDVATFLQSLPYYQIHLSKFSTEQDTSYVDILSL